MAAGGGASERRADGGGTGEKKPMAVAQASAWPATAARVSIG